MNETKRRIIAILLSVCLVAVLFAGCASQTAPTETNNGSEKTERTEIVMWHNFTDHHEEYLDELCEKFNQTQDKYTVVSRSQPKSEYDAKIMQAMSAKSDSSPDIVFGYPSDASNYISSDLVLNFTPYIDDPENGIPEFRDNISEGLYQEITQWGDDAIYVLPTVTTSHVFFYNKTIYDELNLSVPTTWEQVEENSRAIYEAKGIPGFGTDDQQKTYLCMLVQDGCNVINNEILSVEFDNEIGLKWLTWFSDCVKEGIFRLVGEDGYFSNPFGSGAVGSYIGTSAGIDFVKAAVGDKFELGVAPIPLGEKVKYAPSFGSFFYAFKNEDENVNQGIYEFMKFFISEENLPEWAVIFGGLPAYAWARNNADIEKLLEENLAIQALNQEIDYIGYVSSITGSKTVLNSISIAIEAACAGTMTPEEALAQCVQDSNAALKEN